MKALVLTAALILAAPVAYAQTSTVTSTSSSGAAAVVYNVAPGGGAAAGGGGGGGLGSATWVMGQTTGGNAVTSYDACLKNAQLTVLFAAINIPMEISHCWSLRSMDAMSKYPPGSVQYEYGCLDSNWAKVDWDTGTMACTANKAKLVRNSPTDPRGQKMQYVPVVQAGHAAAQQAPGAVPASTPSANCRLVPGTIFQTCG